MYVPFAKELFGLDNNFENGKNLWYFDGKIYSNKSDGVDSKDTSISENDKVPDFNDYGFGSDIACYETAPSMTFGGVHKDFQTSQVIMII